MKKLLVAAAFGLVFPLIGVGQAEACPCSQKSSAVCGSKYYKAQRTKNEKKSAKKEPIKKRTKNQKKS
jgi:hypothetical protein